MENKMEKMYLINGSWTLKTPKDFKQIEAMKVSQLFTKEEVKDLYLEGIDAFLKNKWTPKIKKQQQHQQQRNIMIKKWRDNGFKLREIGDELGLSRERIRQIYIDI